MSSKGINVPIEVWQLIFESIPSRELNILTHLSLSQVSRAARCVFTSDKAWDIFDLYGVGKEFFSNFTRLTQRLSRSELETLRLAWSWRSRYYSSPFEGQVYPQLGTIACFRGLRAWGYTLAQIEAIFVDPNVNRYVKMGILAQDVDNLQKHQISDYNFMRCLVRQHPGAIRIACKETTHFDELCKEALLLDLDRGGVCNVSLEHVSERVKHDRDLVRRVVSINPENLQHLTGPLARDLDILKAAVKADGSCFELVPKDLQNNIELILIALKSLDYGQWLDSLEDNLLNNPAIAEAAVKSSYYGFRKISKSLQHQRKYALLAAKADGRNLKRMRKKFRRDHEIVLASVKENGRVLRYASPKLLANRTIVEAAIENHSLAAKYACPLLTNSRPLALKAVSNWGLSLKYLKQFSGDYEIVLAAVKSRGDALKYAARVVQENPDIILTALKTCTSALDHCPEYLKHSREFVQAAISRSGMALEKLPKFKCDRELVLTAVRNRGMALEFCSSELKNDKEVVLTAVERSPYALLFASQELRDDYDFSLECVAKSERCMVFASERLRNNQEWMNSAVNKAVVTYDL